MSKYIVALLAIAVVASTAVAALAQTRSPEGRVVAHVDDGQDTHPTRPGPHNPQGPSS